jgi:4-hydroxy-tetrahydrodipicolinate reductase
MVNGIPGNMAVTVAEHALEDDRFEMITQSLTGPEIEISSYSIFSDTFGLIPPAQRDRAITDIKKNKGSFISVDFTHPSAVNVNAEFYCEHCLPFVMGTTGGDRINLADMVTKSSISAVIAPNMAKQIVGFQAMMAYAADSFPALFKGYSLNIRESHQKGKADTSGTAKAMIRYFNALGIPYTEADINQERDPQKQINRWGIPEEHLAGHGWHTYSLDSKDRTVHFEFSHNVNGRDVYAEGTLDAVTYLNEKIAAQIRGKVFTMIDVLKGA